MEEELGDQLRDAAEKLIVYGIPWLEDPKTQNPYPTGEELERQRREAVEKLVA